ncbi:hypothetical protein QBC34DRAFT_303422 [Podospora aff. communis PSN243]|uniref:Protein kinase domain-containing protein n=1 Tax=Podospora aff. communis PSN243 TaxID=3040156 RepID=A0AAV9GHA7_9PEZI|nr:hypothetical protein QBC34DRAFT_303422 [Podospora aff. communis PSN243]
MQLGAQFEHQESFATQASIGLDLDSPKDPTAVAKQKLKEMDVDLREASRKPFEGPEFYIPNNSLDSIMTRDAIRTVLPCITPEDMPDDSLDELARDVHGRRVENNSQEIRFRKILAVLVLIGKAETILDFLKAGVTDAELPLKILGESRLFRLAFSTSDKPIRLFRNWEPRHIENFAARQWETLAPFFSRGTKEQSWVHRYDLVWRHPLPFEIIPEDETVKTAGIGNASSGTTSSTSSLDSMRGGNSRLWKVRIHHAHHNLPSYRRLATADRATFKNEVNILTRLNKCNDPHLVKLLLTMEIVDRPGKHHSAYFLIFPLADGNLRQFWKLESPQQGDVHKATYPRWVAKQFYGLVWALCKLHDLNQREAHSLTDHGDDQQSGAGDPFYGIHGDIKPENLLWYKDWIGPAGHQSCPGIIPPKDSVPFGVLQLADFGISKLHHTATRSNNNMRRSTKTYAPPEAELRLPGVSVLARPRRFRDRSN